MSPGRGPLEPTDTRGIQPEAWAGMRPTSDTRQHRRGTHPAGLALLGPRRGLADDGLAEGDEVCRGARGDHAAVHHHGLVHPLAAGVDHVVLDGHEGGEPHVGAHGPLLWPVARGAEHPRTMADGGHRAAKLEHAHDEGEHGRAPAHVVRGEAPRNHQGVEVRRVHVLGRHVRHHRVAMLARVLSAGLVGAHDHHVRALLLQAGLRVGGLQVLELKVDEERHAPLLEAPRELDCSSGRHPAL
mmetsp:Transcript_14075/g.47649  ORF Transcript_14075/g.47649 Transcript_14075/m.47649 type:complete len:242 (+) Transcript_14075:590-1315(+)